MRPSGRAHAHSETEKHVFVGPLYFDGDSGLWWVVAAVGARLNGRRGVEGQAVYVGDELEL